MKPFSFKRFLEPDLEARLKEDDRWELFQSEVDSLLATNNQNGLQDLRRVIETTPNAPEQLFKRVIRAITLTKSQGVATLTKSYITKDDSGNPRSIEWRGQFWSGAELSIIKSALENYAI